MIENEISSQAYKAIVKLLSQPSKRQPCFFYGDIITIEDCTFRVAGFYGKDALNPLALFWEKIDQWKNIKITTHITTTLIIPDRIDNPTRVWILDSKDKLDHVI